MLVLEGVHEAVGRVAGRLRGDCEKLGRRDLQVAQAQGLGSSEEGHCARPVVFGESGQGNAGELLPGV